MVEVQHFVVIISKSYYQHISTGVDVWDIVCGSRKSRGPQSYHLFFERYHGEVDAFTLKKGSLHKL